METQLFCAFGLETTMKDYITCITSLFYSTKNEISSEYILIISYLFLIIYLQITA